MKAGFNGSIPVVVATLTGYAYETVPNKAIIVGQTKGPSASLRNPSDVLDPASAPTLGMLALGAPSLDSWRRNEQGQ